MGNDLTMYFNKELGAWVERGKEKEYVPPSAVAPPPSAAAFKAGNKFEPGFSASQNYVNPYLKIKQSNAPPILAAPLLPMVPASIGKQLPAPVETQSPSSINHQLPASVDRHSPVSVDNQLPASVERHSPISIDQELPASVERHSPPAVERHSPPAIERQSPPAVERHSPPAIDRHSPPAVDRHSPPAVDRHSPPAVDHQLPASIDRHSPASINKQLPAFVERHSPVSVEHAMRYGVNEVMQSDNELPPRVLPPLHQNRLYENDPIIILAHLDYMFNDIQKTCRNCGRNTVAYDRRRSSTSFNSSIIAQETQQLCLDLLREFNLPLPSRIEEATDIPTMPTSRRSSFNSNQQSSGPSTAYESSIRH